MLLNFMGYIASKICDNDFYCLHLFGLKAFSIITSSLNHVNMGLLASPSLSELPMRDLRKTSHIQLTSPAHGVINLTVHIRGLIHLVRSYSFVVQQLFLPPPVLIDQ
jgi:hypothetical protein